jgi:hypothetical protein
LSPIDIRCSKSEWEEFRQLVRQNRTHILAGSSVNAKTPDTITTTTSVSEAKPAILPSTENFHIDWTDYLLLMFDSEGAGFRDPDEPVEDWIDFRPELNDF